MESRKSTIIELLQILASLILLCSQFFSQMPATDETETPPTQGESSQAPSTQTAAASEAKKRKAMEPRSDVWSHFTPFINEENVKKATCHYCKKSLCADTTKNGTSSLTKDLPTCKKIPASARHSQSLLNLQPGSSNLGVWKFDQEALRKALAYMLIVDELPFKFVEREGFKYFMSQACPRFVIPSRITVARDVFQVYIDEKNLLKTLLSSTNQRVCLTTDTWTSIQRLNYMCLTAHYIDKDWKLHKKIINFCTISSHKGKDIGWEIERCLNEWGIERVLTITVDNASSNNTALDHVKDNMGDSHVAILKCKHLHMRCVAHILNLVVTDGLKEVGIYVKNIRNAVRYVRQSASRVKRFKECCELEKIPTKSLLCLDVATRWNSTFLMLDTSTKFEKAFSRFALQDPMYKIELESVELGGVPDKEDWLAARRMTKFLKVFYDLTCKISGSLYVSSNMHFREIFLVHRVLKEWLQSSDNDLVAMTKSMKEKFDKYWGDPTKMNHMIFIAAVLDPRYKLKWVKFALLSMYGSEVGGMIGNDVREEIFALYDEYKPPANSEGNEQVQHQILMDIVDPSVLASAAADSEFVQFLSGNDDNLSKSEVKKYFNEEIEAASPKFDVLEWWKLNEPRFPVLAQVARDVLAMPISTVASESAFSTGK